MLVIKKGDQFPLRPMVFCLYGEPDVGKTSLAISGGNSIFFDLEQGADRAGIQAEMTLRPNWPEMKALCDGREVSGLLLSELRKEYDTIVIDTAEALLIETIGRYLLDSSPKYRNSMLYYGDMKKEFEWFLRKILSMNFDIIFIAHQKEGAGKIGDDFARYIPKMTGGSYDILISKVDMLGYMYIKDRRRTLTFEKNDSFITKNMARLNPCTIPEINDDKYDTFFRQFVMNPAKKQIMATGKQTKSMPKPKAKSTKQPEVTETKDKLFPLSEEVKSAWKVEFKKASDLEQFTKLLGKISELKLNKDGKTELYLDIVKPTADRLNLEREGDKYKVKENEEEKPTTAPEVKSEVAYTDAEIAWCKKTIDALRQMNTYKEADMPKITFPQLMMLAKIPTVDINEAHFAGYTEEIYKERLVPLIEDFIKTATE